MKIKSERAFGIRYSDGSLAPSADWDESVMDEAARGVGSKCVHVRIITEATYRRLLKAAKKGMTNDTARNAD